MQTSIVAIIALVSTALAIPASLVERNAVAADVPVCATGLYSTALCCDTDVLGVADLDCSSPLSTPTDVADFVSVCAAEGKIDMCCVLPVLGQAVLCIAP